MSKKLGFNISDLLSQPANLSVSPTTSTSLSTTSDLATFSNEYQQERQVESSSISSITVPINESNNHLSNYEQLMRASSIYRNQDYSLLPIVNGTYPWIQTDSILKDRFSLFHNQRRLGHPYQNRTPPKRKKPRTSFTRLQILELEKRFHRQKYLASSERSQLAKGLKMTDAQVKTWFQNRRTKWRRQTAEEREQERQAANRLVLTNSHHHRSLSSSPKLTSPSNPISTDNNNSLIYSSASLNALQNLQPWSTPSNHSNLSSRSSSSDDSNQRTNNRQ
ncbi:unnamed protein product [Rotaria magnacalcarata]|uniref:Homeobox domain-containing protein n=1 Tax=Rotaria magnacalcarata TaxID=392030 RepID=A0A816U1M5_9BILA|nr:unnamed protein product [Rotaria magnacalcarata]CAF1566242.1 unnamed protein product [Rotaria magnacalcarata]CAF1931360.1 unnamed protein product [Rotaria magnacalcarata]CAF2034390.1 unnamed protein product [Rotaria magnacalcarata]CAF2106492.1 unnamed protein product [Rotaria magnacalcarata]